MAISAKTGQGLDLLAELLEQILHEGKRRVTFHIPNAEGGALNTLYRFAAVESVDYGPDGMTVVATVDQKTYGMLRRFDPAYREEAED